MSVSIIQFESFGEQCSGRIISGIRDPDGGAFLIVNARNCYGSHNLVAVELQSNGLYQAYRHGNEAATTEAIFNLPDKGYRKVRKFLASKGIGRGWNFYMKVK